MWRKKPIELPPTGVPFILCGLKVWDLLSEKSILLSCFKKHFLKQKEKVNRKPNIVVKAQILPKFIHLKMNAGHLCGL